jgi:hypothetical protein
LFKPLTTFSAKYAVKERARITKNATSKKWRFFGNYQYEFGINLFRKTITPSSVIEFKPDRLLFML